MKGSKIAAEIVEEMKRKATYRKRAEEKKEKEKYMKSKDRNEDKLWNLK